MRSGEGSVVLAAGSQPHGPALGWAVMDKPIVRYRVILTLAALALAAGLFLINRYLPAGFQPFAWGVAAGLLFMLVGVMINWFVQNTLVAGMIILPVVGAVSRYVFPTDAYLIA